jgi:hypothetical protein
MPSTTRNHSISRSVISDADFFFLVDLVLASNGQVYSSTLKKCSSYDEASAYVVRMTSPEVDSVAADCFFSSLRIGINEHAKARLTDPTEEHKLLDSIERRVLTSIGC